MSIEMIVLIAIFVITLLLGVPIMWSMSLACIASCLVSGDVPFAFFAQKMEAGTEKFTFLAIFFFMLAGIGNTHCCTTKVKCYSGRYHESPSVSTVWIIGFNTVMR